MKFGKEFKKQMVPEWIEAYMDYNGLKRILKEILDYKQTQEPTTPLRNLQRKLSLRRSFNGLSFDHRRYQSRKGDSEDDEEKGVIDVNDSSTNGSRRVYKTDFLKELEDGGDIEAKFFKKLDEELNKVNSFFKNKIEEMKHEASLLSKQMDALIALHIKVEDPDFDANGRHQEGCSIDLANHNPLRSREADKSALSGTEHKPSLQTIKAYEQEEYVSNQNELDSSSDNVEITKDTGSGEFLKEEESSNNDQQDPTKILEHVKINNTLESPLSAIKGVFKDSKDEELSFKKEEVKMAEEKLRAVFIEFYQKLLHLKQYSYMNLAAFSKIMKKYEKITSRKASKSYVEVVDNSYLGSSDEVIILLERVETTFIKHFAKSNRRKGMKSLRLRKKSEKHSVTFFSGFFSGCLIAIVVAVVLRIQFHKLMARAEGTSYLVNVLPLYSLFGYIVLHMLMYSADIYFWRRHRINYPFIFDFKPGSELGHREVFLLCTGLAVLTITGFLANLELELGRNSKHEKTIAQMIPLCLVTVVIAILICPFDIIFRSSRYFFLRTFFRCTFAPLYKVRLPDFFLADNLTSQTQAIRNLELYICYYGLGEHSRRQSKCYGHGVYNVFYFVVAVIPFWLRFLQCIRQVWEGNDKKNVYNGLKYFLTIVAVLIRTAFELKKGKSWMVMALISSAVAIAMNTYWDIVQDWGLLQRKSKNPFLRDKLVISRRSIYFVAMVLNVILRIAWLQLVVEFSLGNLQKMAATTIISCLEVIRRGIWNFFRLENEHLNNVGKFRAFKSVPLPFNYYDDEADKDD